MGDLRSASASVVLALCAVGWLVVVPLLVLQGILASVPVFGELGDPDVPRRYFTWVAVLGAGLPLVGVVLAAVTRRKGWTWFFGICLILAAAVAVLAAATPTAPRG